MSVCIRTLSCKLTSFVGQRNQIVQLDRRLAKFISTSASWQEESNISSKQILYNNARFTIFGFETLISLRNTSTNAYATVPKLERKPIDTATDDKYSRAETNKNDDERDENSQKQLEHVFNTLKNDLPKIFCASIDYRIYRPDLEFINNFKGIRTTDLNGYIKQILYMRTSGHIVYAYVKFDILRITMHPEDNTVKVRWRIRGLSSLKIFTQFWKLKFSNIAESMKRMETWYDGFSTYYVDSNGLVYKHVVDKMMPDDDSIPAKNKSDITAKLAA